MEDIHPLCPFDRENPPPIETNASDVAVTVETPAADVQVTGRAVETRAQQKRREKLCKPVIVPNVVGGGFPTGTTGGCFVKKALRIGTKGNPVSEQTCRPEGIAAPYLSQRERK